MNAIIGSNRAPRRLSLKPHISINRDPRWRGRWECAGTHEYGYGDTPMQAFMRWAASLATLTKYLQEGTHIERH